jgi:hypothetical protein
LNLPTALEKLPTFLEGMDDVQRWLLGKAIEDGIAEQERRCAFLKEHPLNVCSKRLLPPIHHDCFFELLPEHAKWDERHRAARALNAAPNDPALNDGKVGEP